jgi:hypothetical protein
MKRGEKGAMIHIWNLQTCSSYSYLQNKVLTTLQHMSKGDGGQKMHKAYFICHIVSHFEAWQAHPWLWVSQKKWFQFLNLEKKTKNTLEKHGEVEYGPTLHVMLCWKQLNLFLQQFNT